MNKIKIGVEYDVNSAWITKLKMTSKDRFTVTTKYIPECSFIDDEGVTNTTPAREVEELYYKGNVDEASKVILLGARYLIELQKQGRQIKKEGSHDN